MSLYSTEPDNLAQHTEGFECGLDVNQTLHMLSDSEQALYDDAKKPAPKAVAKPAPKAVAKPAPKAVAKPAPVEEEDKDAPVLDDSIYDEPTGHVTFAEDTVPSVEEFSTESIVDTIKEYAGKFVDFVKDNWLAILLVLVAVYLAYSYFNGGFPFTRKFKEYFNLSDMQSSSFKGSSSSLGTNYIKTRR